MLDVFTELYLSDHNLIPRTYSKGSMSRRSKWKKEDFLPDTSLLGLVYPAGVVDALDEKMRGTIDKIIEKNTVDNGGLLRYPKDRYCGSVKNGRVTLTGAGAWPLLNFWMAIYLCMCGDKKNARKYFNWPLERTEQHIPEQIFRDKKKSSVSPLAWSHAMFIIAADFLGSL